MKKKIKFIKKVSLAIFLIIAILISTMPYKPKIVDEFYNAKTIQAKALNGSDTVSNRSEIIINKIDSQTKESLGNVEFELTPIEEDITDNMTQLEKYVVRYWNSNTLIRSQICYGESNITILDCNLDNLKGWATEKGSKEIVFLPEETMHVNQDIDLYAVNYNLDMFYKKLIRYESELPSNVPPNLPTITYIEPGKKFEFSDTVSTVTLLYKLVAKGEPGFKYQITDDGAEYVFGDPLNGVIPESGEINCYVIKTFSASDINSDGNLENTARIQPGTNGIASSASTVVTPAVDNTPTYTVTYTDGTLDGSVFGEKIFSGLKFGEKTPEYTGSLERSRYEFQGWAPAVCETVEEDMTYMATWMKRAELVVSISPSTHNANVGDTIYWNVTIKNNNWADTNNVELRTTLNTGKVIYTQENIVLKAGESFSTTIEYVVTEEDAGKELYNDAKVIDYANEYKTAKIRTFGGSHSTGVTISGEESSLRTVASVSNTPTELKSSNIENRALIIDRDTNNYTFIKDETGLYKSNNQGMSSSEAISYIPIDLSEYTGNYKIVVNARISCERRYDYGFVRITEDIGNGIDYADISREFVNITGITENQDYSETLEGGKKYNIIFGYLKDSSMDDGDDTFYINSVKLVFNSKGITDKINLKTDSTGKIVTNIPDGRYILSETSTQEGYKILEYPITIEVINNEVKILENKNLESITISNNNEIAIENITCRVIVHYYLKNSDGEYTKDKLKDDEIKKGVEGTEYKVEPLLTIEKDGIIYELEYEIQDGVKKYITPEEQNGNFRKEDINVNYYYRAKKQIIINKVWIDNNDSLGIRPESITVTLTATVENENGEAVEYPLENIDTKVTLRSKNGSDNGDNWTYEWLNLESYDEKGREIMYVVEEIEVPDEYYSVVSSIDYKHFEIANYKYGSIKIVKVDSKDNNIKLGGAEFKLEKIVENNGEMNIDENFEPIILTTKTEEETLGEAIFENLEYGKYRLTETKAPNGYSLQKKPIDIEITEEQPDYVGQVVNKEKTMLPDTGGNGSIVLTMLGVFCIAIAIKIKE